VQTRHYLDWNATTPVLPSVVAAMQAALADGWGNPSSVHAEGRAARLRVEQGRAALARLGGVDVRDVILTSGGTEANNIALRSAFHTVTTAPPRLVLSALEHPSVTRVAEALSAEGRAELRWIRVNGDGMAELDDLALAFREGPVKLVALQSVNHETGMIQPVVEAAKLAVDHGALLHVDMVQAWGKVPVAPDVGDTRSFAAHKIRGPKGIGALLGRERVRILPVLRGGAQERGLRPGTVDPIACAGLAEATRHAISGAERYRQVAHLRDDLEARLVAMGGIVNGGAARAPHVANLSWLGRDGAELVAALDLEGLAVSSGSACSAGTSEVSPVIRAMAGEARARGAVRFSLGETSSVDDVLFADAATRRVLAR